MPVAQCDRTPDSSRSRCKKSIPPRMGCHDPHKKIPKATQSWKLITKPPLTTAGTISAVMIGLRRQLQASCGPLHGRDLDAHPCIHQPESLPQPGYLPIPMIRRQMSRLHQFRVRPCPRIGKTQKSPVKNITPRRPMRLLSGSASHALSMT